jgi:hypothetical protein
MASERNIVRIVYFVTSPHMFQDVIKEKEKKEKEKIVCPITDCLPNHLEDRSFVPHRETCLWLPRVFSLISVS